MSTTSPSTRPTHTSAKKAEVISRTAAEEAIDVLLTMHERQRIGKLVDAEFVAMVKGVRQDDGTMLKPPPSDIEMLIRRNPHALKIAVCAIGGIAIYGLVVLLSPLWSGFTVAGKAFVNSRPAVGIELVFHSAPTMVEVRRVVADKTGAFSVDLRRGAYKITARSTGPARLSDALASPNTSPLAVAIDKNMKNMNLYLPDNTWQPTPN